MLFDPYALDPRLHGRIKACAVAFGCTYGEAAAKVLKADPELITEDFVYYHRIRVAPVLHREVKMYDADQFATYGEAFNTVRFG